MLRITAQSDPAAACAYFNAGHDYLADGSEKVGIWGGRGATLLGLSGEVKEADFSALAKNRYPDAPAERLTGKDHPHRRVGYDFTWSVAKSVTLALELGGDERILTAFKHAVAETMADIERDVIVRDRRQGREDDVKSGNLIHATFVHRTSRPVDGIADCQLHAHSFVFNASKYDGRWSSVELGQVKADAPFYEAVFQARMGKALVELGYGVRRKGRFYELEGVPDSLIEKFSKRTKLIEAEAARRGITNPDFKAELGGKTRERKSEGRLTPQQLREEWASRLTSVEREMIHLLPGQETPLPDAAQSMAYAIAHHFERSSIVPEKRVYEEALRYGVGSVDLDGLKREAYRQGLIVKGEQSTTLEALKREKRLVAFAREGRGTRRKLGVRKDASSPRKSEAITLNPGQSSAVKHILSSKDRVVLIRGAAGTGKTTMLRSAVEQMNAPVWAIGVSSTAAEELAKEVTPNASTVARFLIDEKLQAGVKGGVVLLDEASLIGTKQMDELVTVLEQQNARLIMVGDTRQHSAVAAGSPFRALQEVAKVPVVEVTEIMRQSGLYKEVASRLSVGETGKAIDLLEQMGWLKEGDKEERTRELVNDYLEAIHKKRSVLVVCPTHKEGDEVTAAIREALRAEGKLGDEREFTRLAPLNQTVAERGRLDSMPVDAIAEFHRKAGGFSAGQRVAVDVAVSASAKSYATYVASRLSLAVGDSLRITKNGKTKVGNHRLLNGSTYTVSGFTSSGDIRLDNGWIVGQDFGHFAHGYVTTSHSSQGKTVDTVLVMQSSTSFPASSTEQAYVSASRGKRAVYWYTDSIADLKEAVGRERPQLNAVDLVGDHIPDDGKMVNRVKSVSLMKQRLKQIARKAKALAEQVRRLTKRREYGIEMG